MKRLLTVIIFILLAGSAWGASPDSVGADSIDGAYMQYAGNATNNSGGCKAYWIGQHSNSGCRASPPQNVMRTLFHFSINSVPADQIIDSAFAYWYLFQVDKYGSCTYSDSTYFIPHPLKRDWNEGNQCSGTQTTGQCSWTAAVYGTQNWTTGGAGSIGNDILACSETDTAGFAYTDDDTWLKMPVTEFVKDLYDGTIANNYGLLIRANNDHLKGDSSQIGMYKFWSEDTLAYQPYVKIYYHEPNPPDTLKVTTWDSEHLERESPSDTSNFGYENPDSSHLVDLSLRFSGVCPIDSATHYYIKVGSSAGATNYWDSGWTSLVDTVDINDRTKKITYGGSEIKDGYKYYWSMALCHTITGDTSEFCSDQTFYGVSAVWWDTSYNSRHNVWLGTDHSSIAAGQIITIPLPTGYGHTFAENALSLDGGQGQMLYYQGWSYFAYMGRDTADGSTGNYIIKQDHSADPDTFSAYHCVEDDVDTLMRTFGDNHYFPQIIIDAQLHKLHYIRNVHDNGLENSHTSPLVHGATYYISSDSSFADSGINITNWETAVHPPAFHHASYIRLDEVSNGDIFATFRHYGDTSWTTDEVDTLIDPDVGSRGYYCMARKPYTGSGWGNWATVKSGGIRDYIAYFHDDLTVGNPAMYCGGMTIDDNDRMHITLSWWEDYSGTDPAGRAISHIYADYDTIGNDTGYIKWYELASTDSVGVTTDSAHSDNNVHYASMTPIDTCDNASTDPLGTNRILVNSDIMLIDDNGYPVIFWPEYDSLDYGGNSDSQADECSLYCARWVGGTDTGNHWDIYNVSAETGYLAWNTRLYGAANIIDDVVDWFVITKPDSGGDYYAGEITKLTLKGMLTADSGMVGFSSTMMSGNSGAGLGRLNTYKGAPDSIRTGFVSKRKQNLVSMQDRNFGKFRADGNDIRIVYTGNTGAHTELDRVPLLAYQLDTTDIAFDFGLYTITANVPAPQYGCIYVYWNNSNAGTPPANPDNVWVNGFWGCEVDSADGAMAEDDSLGLIDANMVSDGFDIGVSTAYADRMWSGDKYATTIDGGINPALCTLTVTANTTNKDVTIHVRQGSVSKNSTSKSYIELLDGTTKSRVYLYHTDSTIQYQNGAPGGYPIIDTDIWAYSNQYHTIKFHVHDTDGITAIYNDKDTIFADIDSIIQFDKIIISGYNLSGWTSFNWDVLTIEKFIDNDVEVWFAPEQTWRTGRRKIKMTGVTR